MFHSSDTRPKITRLPGGGRRKALETDDPDCPFTREAPTSADGAEIKRGTTTIYEADFTYDDVFVKVDILHKGTFGRELCEVKGTTEVKKIHAATTRCNIYVPIGASVGLVKASLARLNNQCVRKGPRFPEGRQKGDKKAVRLI